MKSVNQLSLILGVNRKTLLKYLSRNGSVKKGGRKYYVDEATYNFLSNTVKIYPLSPFHKDTLPFWLVSLLSDEEFIEKCLNEGKCIKIGRSIFMLKEFFEKMKRYIPENVVRKRLSFYFSSFLEEENVLEAIASCRVDEEFNLYDESCIRSKTVELMEKLKRYEERIIEVISALLKFIKYRDFLDEERLYERLSKEIPITPFFLKHVIENYIKVYHNPLINQSKLVSKERVREQISRIMEEIRRKNYIDEFLKVEILRAVAMISPEGIREDISSEAINISISKELEEEVERIGKYLILYEDCIKV